MNQLDLFDIIIETTQENFCEVCKQPSTTNVHPECIELWVMLLFDREKLPEHLKDFYL